MEVHFWIRVYTFLCLWKPSSFRPVVNALGISLLIMGISTLQKEQGFPLVSAPRSSAHWMIFGAFPTNNPLYLFCLCKPFLSCVS